VPLAFSPAHVAAPLPPGHRFPMAKYGSLAQRLGDAGWRVESSPDVADDDLRRAHTGPYLAAVAARALDPAAERRLGFPQSEALVRRARASVGGTVAAAAYALANGLGVALAGGTHHAFADRGEGFCVYNDLVVTARRLLADGAVERVLVVDLDVHQGNGTADACAGDPHVTTFSVHGARNYPFVKARSDLDVALADGTDDDAYGAALAAHLPALFEATAPDVVLYQGGVDVLAGDRFGRMALSEAGVVARDRFVASLCVAAGVPLVTTLGGGYHQQVERTVAAHAAGLTAIAEVYGIG
jgi:acetoin utilization deacetylase AcuC-like enzyme